MNYRFAVITKTPDGEEVTGNLATALDIYQVVEAARLEENGYREVVVRVPTLQAINLRTPVFEAGEILILDPATDREVGYPGRKPSKWLVEWEEFNDLDTAVARSREIVESNLRRGAAGDES